MNSFIDRGMAREQFELAKKHVAEGQRRVDAQFVLVARLQRSGYETTAAKALLYQLEQTLTLQTQSRDRIAQELEEGA